MTVTQEQAAWFAETFSAWSPTCDQAVLGKEHVIRLSLTCMLSEGHLLLEDVPGTGKTAARQGDREHRAGHATAASSSPPTCCRATSPA